MPRRQNSKATKTSTIPPILAAALCSIDDILRIPGPLEESRDGQSLNLAVVRVHREMPNLRAKVDAVAEALGVQGEPGRARNLIKSMRVVSDWGDVLRMTMEASTAEEAYLAVSEIQHGLFPRYAHAENWQVYVCGRVFEALEKLRDDLANLTGVVRESDQDAQVRAGGGGRQWEMKSLALKAVVALLRMELGNVKTGGFVAPERIKQKRPGTSAAGTIRYLRTHHGFTIESAEEARARGDESAKDRRGYHLVTEPPPVNG